MLAKTQKEGIDALERWFAGKQKVAVAFSGGVDSSLLLFLGSRVLGSDCIGLFGRSPLVAAHQVAAVSDFAACHGLVVKEERFSPLQLPGFALNGSDRCYICKKALYSSLQATLLPGWHLVDGTNIDDDVKERPGFQALCELEIATPYLDCGLGKAEIRGLSRALGLSTWNKPSDSCLATRILRHTSITPALLQQIDEAEGELRQLGFDGIRTRPQDDTIHLTFKEGDLMRAVVPEMQENIQKSMARLSFSKVFLDLSERQGILP